MNYQLFHGYSEFRPIMSWYKRILYWYQIKPLILTGLSLFYVLNSIAYFSSSGLWLMNLNVLVAALQDALRTFLLRKLDNLAKDDKCQITMISTWATELYLDKVLLLYFFFLLFFPLEVTIS